MNNTATLGNAIRGPIMLITVGALFAFDHFTPYSIRETWPVILIVLGVSSLFGRIFPSTGGAA